MEPDSNSEDLRRMRSILDHPTTERAQFNDHDTTVRDTIETIFEAECVRPLQYEKMQQIRDEAKHLAYLIMVNCPPSTDRSAAIRKLREAVFTANACIAFEGIEIG